MTIIKQPISVKNDAAQEAFISGAPDAGQAVADPVRRVRKGRKVQISLTLNEAMLDRIDEMAKRVGQSRAALINLAVTQMLQSGLRLDAQA